MGTIKRDTNFRIICEEEGVGELTSYSMEANLLYEILVQLQKMEKCNEEVIQFHKDRCPVCNDKE